MSEHTEKVNETALEVIEPGDLDTMKDALDIIERRNNLFERLQAVAIKATSPADWINQDGSPYLQVTGAEKVGRRFGVRIYDVTFQREEREDSHGDFYIYTATGFAALPGGHDSMECIGTATSRDPLWAKRDKKYIPSKDVPETNIKKKAYSNFLRNAVTRLLGLRNITWEELRAYGVTKDGKTQVNRDKGARAANTQRSRAAESQAKKPFWTSEFKGTTYLLARAGNHFTPDFLQSLGFKAGKTQGVYSRIHDDEALQELEGEFAAYEMNREEVAHG